MNRALATVLLAFASTSASAGVSYDLSDTTFGIGSTAWKGPFHSVDEACGYAERVALAKAERRADAACGGDDSAFVLSEDYTVTRYEMWGLDATCDVIVRIEYACE